VITQEEERHAHCVEVTFDALPEVELLTEADNSQTGVLTKSVLFTTTNLHKKSTESLHWYALHTTYSREKKAFNYIIANNEIAFWPTITVLKKDCNDKKSSAVESRIPNVLFAYGTKKELKNFVYDNVHLPFLWLYYQHHHFGNVSHKKPLIVPDKQIESLKIICDSNVDDIKFVPDDIKKFRQGQLVLVIDSLFKGVEDRVTRWQGQQRVAVIIKGLLYQQHMCRVFFNEYQ